MSRLVQKRIKQLRAQEVRGKFDLKEPYYRQLTQYYAAAAPVVAATPPAQQAGMGDEAMQGGVL